MSEYGGTLSLSIIAGPIRATRHPINERIGKQFTMGADLSFHITPEMARQWIGVLETITEESN